MEHIFIGITNTKITKPIPGYSYACVGCHDVVVFVESSANQLTFFNPRNFKPTLNRAER